jgi:pentatricopeptide repeat protein|tara:strand:+ start:176 stop:403 length:228 start_codon:yes stop_codon:yes gene_type:complete
MYQALVTALSAVGRPYQACGVAQDMIAAGYEPTLQLCMAIVDAAIERGHSEALTLSCGESTEPGERSLTLPVFAG